MKWIKSNERLPERSGDFYIKKNHERYLTTYDIGIGFGITGNIEWLDESESPVPDKVEDAAKELALEAMDFYWRALTDKLNGKDLGDIERKNYEVLTAKLYKLLKQ